MKLASGLGRLQNHLKVRRTHLRSDKKIRRMAALVAENSLNSAKNSVIFFNASTRLSGMSLNAGFSLLSAWSLRLQGVLVHHFVCDHGMTQCVLGTNRRDLSNPPPCAGCVAQSRAAYTGANQIAFRFQPDHQLDEVLAQRALNDLVELEYQQTPLGKLVLPSLRWVLRRHHLQDDDQTNGLLREYIRSAWSIKKQFEAALEEAKPCAVVVYNGMLYPEATARWVARQHNVKVISHEVGMLPMSAFFTEGDATAYPLSIPADFHLNTAQNDKLDRYLQSRFQGNFVMAGVKFWPEMSQLDPQFLARAKQFRQIVPIFTNVIFDTSQPHANVVFEDMFTWLDTILKVAHKHPDTLFVIRAHPDEARKGKASEESVSEWAAKNQVASLENVHFIPPETYISSYDLIRLAKFVAIYNSTIGLEAAILGALVLSAGKARFSEADVALFPVDQLTYVDTFEKLLRSDVVEIPTHYRENARRFLYYQLFRSSLSFNTFLEEDQVWPGYIQMKDFSWQQLLPKNSPTLKAISSGIIGVGDFLLTEEV